MVNFSCQNVELPTFINTTLSDWIEQVIRSHGSILGDLNYLFCDDSHILEVNRTYLQHDYFTDIITFDYCLNKVISGDLVISLDTVKSNSDLFQTSFEQETLRVIIHGVLHLLGFNDHSVDEKQQMRELESKALSIYPTFR